MTRRGSISCTLAGLVLMMHRPALAKDSDDKITIKHLQTLYKGLSEYLKTNGDVWPQVPQHLDSWEQQQWWIKTLKPFGVREEDWTDPRDGNVLQKDRMTYTLASFDDRPLRAYLWSRQVWVHTAASSKSTGNKHFLFPDGSIKADK